MSRKLRSLSAIFALTGLLIAAPSATAQVERGAQIKQAGLDGRGRVATLGCCKCLGGTNTLDLSTISSNNWTVNGSPVVFLTAIHQLWNINPGPAKWVSTVATGGTGTVPAGSYDYKLDFVVPACSIDQKVTLTGDYGGDDDVQVFFDNTGFPPCTGGWCFNTPNKSLSTFTATVGPGTHSLRVKVTNDGPSPSGMFVNAKLVGTCSSELTKPR
ncbi:MAG TPA: hypothetical protein VF538_04610 [Pyrinomonadaceae bacterium]